MMRYKLGEIFNLQMGKTPDRHSPKFWNEGTEPWISIADLTKCNKYIENTAEKITATAVDGSGIKIIPKNTVIMSFKLSIGKVAITPKEMYSNEAIMSFIDKGVLKIEPVYLYYLLMHKDWDTGTNKAVMGKTLNKASLSQMTVNIHGYSEQLEIIKALDAASSIIAARKQQLAELDKLIKSRFVELFGDCKSMVPMNELCSIITDGTHQPPRFQESGIPFIFVSNLVGNVVTYNAEKFISEDTYAELYKRTPIEIGDLLLSTVGSYGHPAVVTEDRKFLFQRHIAYLKPRHNMVNSFYLHSALLAPDGQRQIEEKVKGIAQKTLNLSEIKKIVVPLPTIEEQNQFEKFVNQIDKSKVAVQKALDEAQTLFDSLMQKYFG